MLGFDKMWREVKSQTRQCFVSAYETVCRGFETNVPYSVDQLRLAAANGQTVNLIADLSGVEFGFRLLPETLSPASVHVRHVTLKIGGKTQQCKQNEHRRLTFVNHNGYIKVVTGWVQALRGARVYRAPLQIACVLIGFLLYH
ncbi:MAG: hypothetical protein PVI21_01045 [Candidatus Woesebacteria bacterium]|jgi:hypothetical protein